jgi:hypothetical protein
MRKPIDDDNDWTLIREHLELDEFPTVVSSTPPERYREISCTIHGFSTNPKRALGAIEPQPQSRTYWLKIAAWGGIAAVSALCAAGLIWLIQTTLI